MSYRIDYAWYGNTHPGQPPIHKRRIVIWLALVLVLVTIRVLVPESAAALHQLLHPFTDEFTITEFAEMMTQIGDGLSVEEAVTAFCQDILNNGNR